MSKFNGNVLYCVGQGFYIYNGKYWNHDAEGLGVLQIARELVSEIFGHIDNLRGIDSDQQSKLKKAAAKLKSADFVTKAIKLVKSEPDIQISSADFEQNKYLINLMNGTFDLLTGELKPYNATDRLNYIQDYSYDKDADCPTFKGLLSQVLSEDQAEYLIRVAGYALAGLGVERRFFILYGRGKNAKSTVVDALSSVFGHFAVTVQPESLNGSMAGQIRNDLARLHGARLMVTSETKAGTVVDAPLLKQLTGGTDKLTARFLHKEFIEFKPVCVPFIVSNYKPVIDGSDAAIGSRICLIYFKKTIETPDVNFSAKLMAEKSGIFNVVMRSSC